MGNKNKTQAPNEKQRTAIMVLALIIVIAFLGAGIFCIVNEFMSKKNGTASTGSAAVGNLEESDNIFGEEYVVVTDENGKEVTDENGKKVTEKVLYKETTDKNGKATTTEITETVLVIELTHKAPNEMALDYHFTVRQNTYLQLLQDPQYEELWAELLGGFAQGGGELMNPDSTRTPTGTLQWPLPVAGTITSPFGHRIDPLTGEVSSHTGTDIACAEGTPILAAADGIVTVANGLDSWGGSYGYYIQIDHGTGLETLYAHCSSICVTTGQQVQAGQVIGYVGHTGRATGSHLHFEVRANGNRVNPLQNFL